MGGFSKHVSNCLPQNLVRTLIEPLFRLLVDEEVSRFHIQARDRDRQIFSDQMQFPRPFRDCRL